MKKDKLRKYIRKIINEQKFDPNPVDCENFDLLNYIISNYSGEMDWEYIMNTYGDTAVISNWCLFCSISELEGDYVVQFPGDSSIPEPNCACCSQFTPPEVDFEKPDKPQDDISIYRPPGGPGDISTYRPPKDPISPISPVGGNDIMAAWYCNEVVSEIENIRYGHSGPRPIDPPDDPSTTGKPPKGGGFMSAFDPDPEATDCVYIADTAMAQTGLTGYPNLEACIAATSCTGPLPDEVDAGDFNWFDHEDRNIDCSKLGDEDGPLLNYMEGQYGTEEMWCGKCQNHLSGAGVTWEAIYGAFNGTWLAWCTCCDDFPFINLNSGIIGESVKSRFQKLANIKK